MRDPRGSRRWSIALIAATVATAATAVAAPAPPVLTCQIDKTRTFTPSLGSVSSSSTYTFSTTGQAICEGVSNGAPAVLVGTVSVGNKFATPSAMPACDALPTTERCADPGTQYGTGLGCAGFTEPCTEVPGGDGLLGCGRTDWWWQEPAGVLVGTAASNTTTETRFIRWDDSGDVTIIQLDNIDIGHLKLEGANAGTIVAGAEVTMTGPDASEEGCPRQPGSHTIVGARDVGAQVRGALWALTPVVGPSCTGSSGCPWVRLVGGDIVRS